MIGAVLGNIYHYKEHHRCLQRYRIIEHNNVGFILFTIFNLFKALKNF